MHLGLKLGLAARRGGGGSPYALFLIVGQSNAIGRATFDSGNTHPAGTLQWNQSGEEAAATIPLDHVDDIAGDMGLDIEFARSYAAANPDKTIVFIPYADGATGFNDNVWNPDDTGYDNAVAAANAAIANYGTGLSGILWHQGERDAAASWTQSQYRTALQAMISGMRSDITGASNVPFVVGEIGSFLGLGSYPTRDAVNLAINETDEQVAYTAVVETGDLADGGDNIHFDAASIRTMGTRYYTAWVAAQANAHSRPAAFVDANWSVTSGSEGELSVSIASLPSALPEITDIEYELDASGSWVSSGGTSGFTVASLTAGQEYDVRLRAVNSVGAGDAGNTETATAGSAAGTTAIEAAVTASSSTAFWAPTDGSLLFQDSALTTAASSDADPVGGIDVATGTVDVLQSTAGSRPARNDASGLLDFATAKFMTASIGTRGSNMYLACVVNMPGTEIRAALFGTLNTTTYAGLMSDGDTVGAVFTKVGTPTIKVDNSVVTTRGALRDALCDGADHVVEFVGLDLTANANWTTLRIGGNGGAPNDFDHLMGDIVLCDTPASGEQDNIRAELAARHGITL